MKKQNKITKQKQYVSLSRAQWEILLFADEKGAVSTENFSIKRLEGLTQERDFNNRMIRLLESNAPYNSYRLTNDGQVQVNRKKLADGKRKQKEQEFEAYWKRYGDWRYKMTTQAQVIPNRKIAFDFAFLEEKVLIEIQGGVGNRGRHVRIGGYNADCEKLNLAVAEGYKVFWLTSQMIATHAKAKHWIDIISNTLRSEREKATSASPKTPLPESPK